MCGLAGVIWRGRQEMDLRQIGEKMSSTIQHRGPDDSGVWCDVERNVLLVHTRLSIVDLSPAGHQPMVSECQRYVLVFNGEIYNHLSMRAMLDSSVRWRGHSDTETLLACFAAWGIDLTLQRSVGMFAFALWDLHEQRLTLGRDRLGEKPLYYGWHGDAFLFGSELKSMDMCPGFSPSLNREALSLFLRYGVVPAPYSIWEGIFKLEAGCIAELNTHDVKQSAAPTIRQYWSLIEVSSIRNESLLNCSDAEAMALLDHAITTAVQGQLLSDVPLGAFLSGGIDSSLVVAMMQKLSSQPVKTFSIGFDVPGFNEAEHAQVVAHHFGTDHTELYIQAEDALKVIPLLPILYDEPFADSSQIPTFLVSQLASQHVTVALSGDGGDELFCGYTRYLQAGKLISTLQQMPRWVRRASSACLGQISPRVFELAYRGVMPLLPAALQAKYPGNKFQRLQHMISAESDVAMYGALISHCFAPDELVKRPGQGQGWLTGREGIPSQLCLAEKLMLIDGLSYLADDILVKVDRAAMGVSLETRVPLLDHRVVELAWQLPMHYKLRGNQTKWLLRQVLYQYVPQEMIDRPKMGFGVPIDQWLRGPLRSWAEALLDPVRLVREDVFNVTTVSRIWQNYLSGNTSSQYLLWDILMFQSWLENRQRDIR